MSAWVLRTAAVLPAAEFDALLDGLEEGVVLLEADAWVITVNAAATALFDGAVAPDQRFSSQLPFPGVWDAYQRCLATHAPADIEFVHQRRTITATFVPLSPYPGGRVLLRMSDASGLRRLERTRREFVANVSHELRTPLAAVRAAAESLQEGALESPDTAAQFLHRITAEVSRMTGLVTGLLDLSRLESGHIVPHLESALLRTVVVDAMDSLAAEAERAGIALRVQEPAPLPALALDPALMRQVVINLLSNAIRFSPPHSTVTATLTLAAGHIACTVRDPGPGIAEEHLPHVFERFYKVDRARGAAGTGLGLAIVKHIVVAHGGDVWVDAKPGAGSTFGFTLPLGAPPPG